MRARQGLLAALAVVVLGACTACGAKQEPRLIAGPSASLVDQPVSIEVRGLRPGTLVSVSVDENGWVGRGVFRADRHGNVSPARQPSLRGTYTGLAPMGLFWSMREGPGFGPWSGGTVRVTAVVRGSVVGRAKLTRRARVAGVKSTSLSVRRDGFNGRFYRPARGASTRVPVLLIGGSEGGLSMTAEAALLASHGFPALDVAYFGAAGLPRNLQRIPLEYFVGAARWLGRQPGVDPHRLVVYGVSRGTEAAMLLAAHFPTLFAGVVVLSPSSYVKGAFVPGKLGVHGAAWTVGGRPIAYITRKNPHGGAIPFRSVRADVFVTAGLEDNLAFGYPAEQDMVAKLSPLPDRRVIATVYPHGGHFIDTAVPYLPWGHTFYNEALGVTETLGGSSAGDSTARADEWPRILRFVGSVRARPAD